MAHLLTIALAGVLYDYYKECTFCAPATVNYGQQATFLVSLLLLGLALYMLERFIKNYALKLVDREKRVKKLSDRHKELGDQLNMYRFLLCQPALKRFA